MKNKTKLRQYEIDVIIEDLHTVEIKAKNRRDAIRQLNEYGYDEGDAVSIRIKK